MKKAQLLMAAACLIFFSALAYTNLISQQPDTAVPACTHAMQPDHPPASTPEPATTNVTPPQPRPVKVTPVAVKLPVQKPVKKSPPPPQKDEIKPPVKDPAKEAMPIADFLHNGIDWLAKAQYENGGWGAGQHNAQHIRNPKAVNIDPATTAFSAMALMHADNTLEKGTYSKNLRKALDVLLDMAEKSDKKHPNITDITGTQPQRKLGQNIDVAMTAQFFAKILDQTQFDETLYNRTEAALKKCVTKIQNSQQKNGSWNDRGWAPVLQSAMANNALEMSDDAGIEIDNEVLDRSRKYQKQNVTTSGDVAVESAAGIKLYAASSTQRATAEEAKKVRKKLKEKKAFKRMEAAKEPPPATAVEDVVELLEEEGIDKDEARELASSYMVNKSAAYQMKSDAVLSGFGNNGGEEYLSYMMTSESLVADDNQEEWLQWHQKMSQRLGKVQNGDGSWSGHHCITSPVFCTAAVIMTLTADRKQDQ